MSSFGVVWFSAGFGGLLPCEFSCCPSYLLAKLETPAKLHKRTSWTPSEDMGALHSQSSDPSLKSQVLSPKIKPQTFKL